MPACILHRVYTLKYVRGSAAIAALLAVFVCFSTPLLAAPPEFISFEAGQVRPLALSPDGSTLFATNTPNYSLDIFRVSNGELRRVDSVPVGMEPVAVAVRDGNEVWVINHLSDSVSIVRLDGVRPRVVRTLLVGDEPRDIVFAGPARQRAFITTAHRGQRRTDPALSRVPGAGDAKLQTPGVPRADVWVFDAAALNDPTHAGVPVGIVELYGDTPRALAVSPDGNTVYAAVFNSGNQTTVVSSGVVCLGFQTRPCKRQGVTYPGGNPGPATNHAGATAPQTAMIVKYNALTGHFEDELGRNWDAGVRFSLPDYDVFAIDAARLVQTRAVAHVGTTLFNMAVNPVSGTLYVSNTEANNMQRFEGPGQFGASTVQGHIAESRITLIDGNTVAARHLNKHINYDQRPAPPGTAGHSLATPLDMVVAPDGKTLYVAAFGSGKIGVYDTRALADNSFDPRSISSNHIRLSGGGPSGLALDAGRQRLYVLTRFDNSVTTIDLTTHQEVNRVAMQNPEPSAIREGRRFLYDANLTSSNGEASCSSCHIFGHTDHLAWDLGNPDEDITRNPAPIKLELGVGQLRELGAINGTGKARDFHPMKGPMVTQSLRGMRNHGAMHWRGDRATGVFGTDTRTTPPFNSRLSFKNFLVAFPGLNGSAAPISDLDMERFADFVLPMTMPPNPVRRLDNSLTTAQQAGRNFYFGCDSSLLTLCRSDTPVLFPHNADGLPLIPTTGFTCVGCHTLNPARGFFGTDGTSSFESLSQIIKIPQLRNMYEKVGMFGHPDVFVILPGNNGHQGPQVRGFGFVHDGTNDTLLRFFNAKVFRPAALGQVGFTGGDPQRFNVVEFMMAFDNDLPPIIGQQITPVSSRLTLERTHADLLRQRASANFVSAIYGGSGKECDLVVTGLLGTQRAAWYYDPARNLFQRGSATTTQTPAQLAGLADQPGQELTYTCAPLGSGARLARTFDEGPGLATLSATAR